MEGFDVPQALQALWHSHYKAEATCVAVVGPQETRQLIQWVQEAFHDMPTSRVWDCNSTNEISSGQLQDAEPGGHSESKQKAVADPVALAKQLPVRHSLPTDVVSAGRRSVLVRVCPQRDLRELELSWYIPQGMMTYSR